MAVPRRQLLSLAAGAMVTRLAVIAFGVVVFAAGARAQEPGPFPAPKTEPPIVTPGKTNSEAPSDAIVLFNGKDLSRWRAQDGAAAKWNVRDGYVEVAHGSGDISTSDRFGDVLDSYDNKTYYHGQAGAVYKQHAPLVNASRKPGQWQAYDIVFHAPRFDEQGKVIDRARVTVLHNGVLIQNNVEIYGITYNDRPALYIAHPAEESLRLQDHGNPVRYRNIWIRRL